MEKFGVVCSLTLLRLKLRSRLIGVKGNATSLFLWNGTELLLIFGLGVAFNGDKMLVILIDDGIIVLSHSLLAASASVSGVLLFADAFLFFLLRLFLGIF